MLCGAAWKTCECPWFNYSNVNDPDRLRDMRVPYVVEVPAAIVRGEMRDEVPRPAARNQRDPARTYQEEVDARRRQERADAALARRLQLAAIEDDDEDGGQGPERQQQQQQQQQRGRHDDIWGIGNAGTHFMNENFVHNAANVVMAALGDASVARRGERESARRRNGSRQMSAMDPGLAPNAFGSESVLGIPPAAPPIHSASGLRNTLRSIDREARDGVDLVGDWLRRM